jgi:hypothetical protein
MGRVKPHEAPLSHDQERKRRGRKKCSRSCLRCGEKKNLEAGNSSREMKGLEDGWKAQDDGEKLQDIGFIEWTERRRPGLALAVL